MKYYMQYEQNSEKTVSRYVHAPLVTDPREAVNEIFDKAHEMFVASGGKKVHIEVYNVFTEPMILTYDKGDDAVMWEKPT